MANYLMLDIGGVFEGDCIIQSGDEVKQDDLMLKPINGGGYYCLTKGVEVVKRLNELADQYDFQIVLHSANSEADQFAFLEALNNSCAKMKLRSPRIYAMAVQDQKHYPNRPANEPLISFKQGILIAGYGKSEQNGKADMRMALSQLLEIKDEDRKNHYVFDDGKPIIKTAQQEGYNAILIGEKDNAIKLYQALNQVAENAAVHMRVIHHSLHSYPDYLHIQNHIHTLQKEIDSSWPYPNKARKTAKIRFLKAILNAFDEDHGKEPDAEKMKNSVLAAKNKYPHTYALALLGKRSTRTRDLITQLENGPLRIQPNRGA